MKILINEKQYNKIIKTIMNEQSFDIDMEDIVDELDDEITYFYKDSDIIIAQPLTERAAVFLSYRTGWPIEFGKYSTNKDLKKYDNEFEKLNSQGPIYVIIEIDTSHRPNLRRSSEKRYMVHFESNQIIDDQDRPLSLIDLMKKDEIIEDFFIKNRLEEVKKVLADKLVKKPQKKFWKER